MTDGSADAVVRVGQLVKNYGNDEARALNWSTLPKGYDMQVRMSGLVWPEASQRIANSAYLTRERLGRGQIILFSGQPNFRGAMRRNNSPLAECTCLWVRSWQSDPPQLSILKRRYALTDGYF